jgi:hypothetical protein
MSQEQFQFLMAAVMGRGGQGGGEQGGHGHRGEGAGDGWNQKLIAKYINVNNFNGNPAEWDDWCFIFKRTLRAQSLRTFKMMEIYELDVIGENGKYDSTFNELDDDHRETETSKSARGGELYDILCQNCTGEALSIVKAVTDMEGWTAWKTLFKKYNPKTMARGVRLVCEVTNPPRCKDLTEIEGSITKWEEKRRTLTSQFSETLSPVLIVAIFTNMMPTTVQDYIYSIVDFQGMTYENLKERVRGMVSNKIAMNMGPAPMDIGGLQDKGQGGGEEDWNEDWDIGAVGMHTKCYRCQGHGHLSRDCATAAPEKGKGKGAGPGKGGKGYEKGKGKGWEKGKGKGKGNPPGTCWTCGLTGHRSYECTTKVQGVDEEPEEAEVPIGGVWMIGQVEAVWSEVARKKKGRRGPTTRRANRFEALSEETECSETAAKVPSKSTGQHDEEIMIAEVDANGKEWTRASGMMFHVADVAKPLASAAKVCEAGNRIVMDPEPGKSYVENVLTGERMMLKKERGTFVFEVEFMDDGGMGNITLDSGAGVSVWPKKLKKELPTLPKQEGLNMIAANGTKIENFGQKLITFKGLKSPFTGQA